MFKVFVKREVLLKAEMNQIAQTSSSTGWLLRSTSKNKLNTSTYSVSFKESASE